MDAPTTSTAAPVQPTGAPPVPPPDEPKFLDGHALSFRITHSRLELQQAGEDAWTEVSLVRLFPISEPNGWFAVLDKDSKELGILKDLKTLAHDSQASIRHELHRRYMIPDILRVVACRTKFDLVEWDVETNRGRVTFLTKQRQEQPRTLIAGRISITDLEGNRYDIPDLGKLDAESRRSVDEWI